MLIDLRSSTLGSALSINEIVQKKNVKLELTANVTHLNEPHFRNIK